jgi:homoserine trans-succinylase
MKVTGRYDSTDIVAVFTADTYEDDFGVPRSRFTAVAEDDAELTSLEILGLDVDVSTLPQPLQDEIYSLRFEVDWSPE